MFSLVVILFVAGLLTVLLPCILPLIPIVLGVSIAGRNTWRPLVTVAGMLLSFVASTLILNVLLSQFIELADYIRIGTYYILLLFGCGFLFHTRSPQFIGAILGGFFFWNKGPFAMLSAIILGIIAVEIGGRLATRIQQLGSDVQTKARVELGDRSLLGAFIIGMSMGLVWVPCAGPALGFVLTIVRNQPGVLAVIYLSAYAIGAGIPLLLIGYGGQKAMTSVRSLGKYSGRIKEISGVLLIVSALALQFNVFQNLQVALVQKTGFGTLGNDIEVKLFEKTVDSASSQSSLAPRSSQRSEVGSSLPILRKAPDSFIGLGTWHNSAPLTLESLRGKVVLIDFWTYSCINCIRTLPYIEAYAEKYKNQPFVLIGIHTPEFTFEKSATNVSAAIKKYGLTYPVAQDNDFQTWNAFDNHYWPAKYLIDANGNIRYQHFGEGNYQETDEAIAALLSEIGANADNDMSIPPEISGIRRAVTKETYLHSRSWSAFGNSVGSPDAKIHTYVAPERMNVHEYYLNGDWQLLDDERQVLRSTEGEIRIRALAAEVHLVLGLEDGVEPVKADIVVDGKTYKSIVINHHDLYTLFKDDYGQHDVILKIHGAGVSAFAFTFG
jgi:cytochrome c biogenesis protein CcdA/thiol-disulfide isomerase/thioredoxin